VLQLSLQDVPRHLAAIRQACQRRDPKLLATSAHGLKSSSAHIGAMKLSAMCAALEADARAGALVRAEPALASLEGHGARSAARSKSAMAEMIG